MTTQGTNDTRRTDLFKTALALGKEYGDGQNARPGFAKVAFYAAADGVIISGKGEDDVFKLFEQYARGVSTKFEYNGLADRSEKSTKVQVSKLRQHVIVGGMPMFQTSRDNGTSKVAQNFLKLIDERIAALCDTSDKAVPIYDKYCAIMRAQRAKVKAGVMEPLTSNEIDEAITSKGKNPEELAKVRQVLGRLRKLAEDPQCAGSAEYLIAAAKVLAPRVSMLEELEEETELEEQMSSLTPEQKARLVTKLAA